METKANRNPCTKLLSIFTKITPIFNLEFVVFPHCTLIDLRLPEAKLNFPLK